MHTSFQKPQISVKPGLGGAAVSERMVCRKW